MTRFNLLLLCANLCSCSLVFDSGKYTEATDTACTSTPRCQMLRGDDWVCDTTTGDCVDCDVDGDAFFRSSAVAGAGACFELTSELRPEQLDCDDDAPDAYPGATPICGDMRVQACPDPRFEALLTFADLEEVGFVGTPRIIYMADEISTFSVSAVPTDRPHDVALGVIDSRGEGVLIAESLTGEGNRIEVDLNEVTAAGSPPITSIGDVLLEPFQNPDDPAMSGGVIIIAGSDGIGYRVTGAALTLEAGSPYTGLVSAGSPEEVLAPAAFAFGGGSPGVIMRQPGNNLVFRGLVGEPVTINDPVIPGGYRALLGTGAVVLGEAESTDVDGAMYYWDARTDEAESMGAPLPVITPADRLGRPALGMSAASAEGDIPDYVVAWFDDTARAVAMTVIRCTGLAFTTCTNGPIATFDAALGITQLAAHGYFFASLIGIEDPDGSQTVTVRLIIAIPDGEEPGAPIIGGILPGSRFEITNAATLGGFVSDVDVSTWQTPSADMGFAHDVVTATRVDFGGGGSAVHASHFRICFPADPMTGPPMM